MVECPDWLYSFFIKNFKYQKKQYCYLKAIATAYRALTMSQALSKVLCTHPLPLSSQQDVRCSYCPGEPCHRQPLACRQSVNDMVPAHFSATWSYLSFLSTLLPRRLCQFPEHISLLSHHEPWLKAHFLPVSPVKSCSSFTFQCKCHFHSVFCSILGGLVCSWLQWSIFEWGGEGVLRGSVPNGRSMYSGAIVPGSEPGGDSYCVTLGKLLTQPVPQFLHQYKGIIVASVSVSCEA